MFDFKTMWDLYEFKLFLLLVTGAIAIVLGNYIHNKTHNKDKDD